ncbi:alpha/beta hydrolase [Streptomyces sp. PsTaAH-124]|uniref:alpha/beta hydrolase n=1 Tax=Streptomyces sp. PsTaAH-124 TaxID=1157638 RepID=UPI000361B6C5|nr:alpha/beta hydrolase [Streptomyces sp. PsTaAH-124]
MTYSFDPELAAWVSLLSEADFSEIARVRQVEAQLTGLAPRERAAAVDIRDLTVPATEEGPGVGVRIYSPAGRRGGLPGLLYMHGGGFAIGSVDTFHVETSHIAAEVGAVVASVEYRLAPEHPFPAALDDCYAVLKWMVANSDALGVDPERIGVAGESAGAGLAAGLALYARDRGGPALVMQYLGTPVVDDRLDTLSMRAFTDTPGWNRYNAELSWDYYLGGRGLRGGDDISPYAAPARAEDLSGLPPAYVTACEFDPLRDEDLGYARRLISAGVPAEVHHFPGTFHGSAQLAPHAGVSRRMIAELLDALRRGLRAADGE